MNQIRNLEDFINGVVSGEIRGQSFTEKIRENIAVELSVGSLQTCTIVIKVLVEEHRFSGEEGDFFRRLYKYSNEYRRVHEEIRDRIEDCTNSNVRNHHEWVYTEQYSNDYIFLPDYLSSENTHCFQGRVRVVEELSAGDLIEANRRRT